jgi:hypothetical protein
VRNDIPSLRIRPRNWSSSDGASGGQIPVVVLPLGWEDRVIVMHPFDEWLQD